MRGPPALPLSPVSEETAGSTVVEEKGIRWFANRHETLRAFLGFLKRSRLKSNATK